MGAIAERNIRRVEDGGKEERKECIYRRTDNDRRGVERGERGKRRVIKLAVNMFSK